ncbi:hypothetical protein A9Q86_02230 [Flavobacteriales bacterium 33_180_T64]|nr:hypothetical protein A9Q86_02230 [Flavobacteriales bacterium 33_180_T64]
MKNTVNTGLKVPDKYNGNQLTQVKNYALFMDYINVNFTGSPVFNFEGVKATFEDYGTKVFDKRVTIDYKGQEFGTLVFSPRSAIIDEHLCQFKLSNHLFYTNSLSTIKNQLIELTELMGLTYKNINRLDIALDFNESNHNVTALLRNICNNDVLISGREKDVNIFSQTKKGKMTFQGVRIGARTSSRFLRIYNKTLESKKNLKTYILDAWSNMGITNDETNPVWRYEYQLSNKFLSELEGITLDSIFSNEGLFNLLKTANSNHFELKHNTEKAQVNQEQNFAFICWDSVANTLELVSKTITKIKRVIKETLIGQQRMVKSLLRSYVSTGQRLEYILPMKIMLSDFGLWDWFSKKLPFYLNEFEKKQFIKSFNRSQFNEDLITEI